MALTSKLYSAGRNLRRDTPQARKGTCYYTDFRLAGVRHRVDLGQISHAEAVDLLDQAMKKARAAQVPSLPAQGPYKLREVQGDILSRQMKPPRPLAWNTWDKYNRADKQALAWFGQESFLEDVTRETVETWLEQRDEEVGPCTLNRDLKRLRQVCKWAVEKDWLSRNPLDGIPLYREQELEIVPLTIEELAKLELECEAWLWDMARFAMLTGLRQIEQLSLRWDQIRGDMLRVDPTVAKSRKARQVVLSPAAVEILERQRQAHRHDLVFPTDYGHVWNRNNLMHRHWRPSVRAAGLAGVTWHRLRHEYCSRLIAGGVAEYVVRELAGHESPKTLRRYVHLAPDFKREVVKILT